MPYGAAPVATQVVERPARVRRPLRPVVAVVVPTMLFALHAAAYGRWQVDDAGITFAYARSVAAGAGPVLQPGLPPVEGYSNPSWLGLLVLGRQLGLFDHGTWFGLPDYVAFPKALALLCVAAAFAACYAVAAACSRRPVLATVLAGAVAAAIPSFVIWCVSGLENPLLVLAVTGSAAVMVWAWARGRLAAPGPALACGLLAALAALTRPEGLVYAAAYPLAVLLTVLPARRRGDVPRAALATAVSVAGFAVPVGGYLVWRWSTFGQLLPTTAVAKSQGLPTVAGLTKVTELGAYVGWVGVLAAALLVAAALLHPSPARGAIALLLVPLGLAVLAFGVLVPDWMEQYRFATPVWALGALVVALALVETTARLQLRGRAVVGVLAVVVAVLTVPAWVDAVRTFRAAPTAPMCLIVQNTGREFNGYLDVLGLPAGTFFAPEIGGAALAGRALLVDGAGLAEPRIARYWAAKDPAGVRDYVLDEVRPTFIRAHGEFRPFMGFDADPRFVADYLLIGSTPNGGGNWVRRDLVRDAAVMDRLRQWAIRADAADAAQRSAPRSSCGDRLVPGAVTA